MNGETNMIEKVFDEEMIRRIVLTWYASTNEHRPVEEFETMLSENVEMRYPNKPEPVIGRNAFRSWYANVLQLYFDETHEVESWKVSIDGTSAVAEVIVRWEYRSWQVGAARSKYDAYLSRQRFDMEQNRDSGATFITRKTVLTFDRTTPLYGIGA